jgi:hypothetical protein
MSRLKPTTLYRYITGPDDAAFCHRISEALSLGWMLYGNPTLAFDDKTGRVICGQALIKDVEGVNYSPDLDLSKQ